MRTSVPAEGIKNGARRSAHHFKTEGEVSRFQLGILLVAILVVTGVTLVRSGIDVNDPIWQIVGFVIALAIGGLGTRMCVYVHPDDCASARRIADSVL